MEHLKIKIHPSVFKLKDPKVDRLRSGSLSVRAFSLLATGDDPYVLVGDTIYALTETEYYAMRSAMPINAMTENAFRHVVEMPDLSFMREVDRSFVLEVRDKYKTCAACKYRKYKDEIYKLIKKYNIQLPHGCTQTLSSGESPDKAEYPGVSEEFDPVVSSIVEHMYKRPLPDRKPCIDCVEKHVSQAWVLSREALNGYPEYISNVIGHLGEALDELPDEFNELRASLAFCRRAQTSAGYRSSLWRCFRP